jgi:hypothetical protein
LTLACIGPGMLGREPVHCFINASPLLGMILRQDPSSLWIVSPMQMFQLDLFWTD